MWVLGVLAGLVGVLLVAAVVARVLSLLLPAVELEVGPGGGYLTERALELIGVWSDPHFDPARPAAYYARVLEIPTPRWTAYEAKRYGVQLPPEVEMVTQERAYTSPIWYTPASKE